MKKYGRQHQHPANTPDNHPSKGFVNWWEAENHNGKSKKRERQIVYKEIKEQLSGV